MPTTQHPLPVLSAASFRVTFGAQEGDALGVSDDLVMDDRYEVQKGARIENLMLLSAPDGSLRTVRGKSTHTVTLDALLRFMCPDGRLCDALLLIETDRYLTRRGVFLAPLVPLHARTPYTLMAIDRPRAREVFAKIGCASFASGTHITLPNGAQQPIETLRVGDPVLTRDDGPQPIRWIGRNTQRATGVMAPIEIASGTLHNTGPLLLSPAHRLFIYQRRDALGLGRAEMAVRADDLLGSHGVTRREGGFVDYVQLVFDSHQIIFAEGIAAESMLIDRRAEPLVSAAVTRKVAPAHAQSDLAALDAGGAIHGVPDVAARLRATSTG